jgi:hypothetical protein
MNTQPTVYVGTMLDGTPVSVTIWPGEGVAQLATKEGAGQWARWSPPTELVEEPADAEQVTA